MAIEKVISGGQTGVDQAALDFAIRHGISHGGKCPKGRLSENGRIPDRYQLVEVPAPTYPPRTEANVLESDATVIFSVGSINDEAGCLLTASLCKKHGKKYAVIRLDDPDESGSIRVLKELLSGGDVKTLNVAGARGSRNPDVAKMARILEGGICGTGSSAGRDLSRT